MAGLSNRPMRSLPRVRHFDSAMPKIPCIPVASAAPRALAIAATSASDCAMARPALVVKLRSGHTSALPRYQTPGSGRQNLRQTSLPTRLRATRRFPFGINASPYRISACVIAVMNNWDGGWPANQARTVSAGAGFTTSETTFVSRTIICRSSAADGSVRAALPAIPLL